MHIDPQHSLQLAFQHLEAFSLPGVGTFKRTYFAASVDHTQKKILPPGERFVLEKGEALSAQLEDFYFRYLDVNISRAKELVKEVSEFVLAELKKAGTLVLPGWGELNGSADKIAFTHEEDLAATPDAFFGLQPVNFSFGELVATDEGSRKAAATASVESKALRVEPAPPPVRRRKRRPWLIALLVLLLVGSGVGMIWQDQFMGLLDKIGLVDQGKSKPTKSLDHVVPIDTSALVITDPVPGDTATKDTAPKDMEPGLVDPVQPVDPIPEPPTKTSSINEIRPGEYAKAGNYYLIVAAAGSGDEAKGLLSKFRKAGAKPRIIAPRGRGNYKISVFQSTDKMAVIDKMVEWKDAFPVKSWIYWMGM